MTTSSSTTATSSNSNKMENISINGNSINFSNRIVNKNDNLFRSTSAALVRRVFMPIKSCEGDDVDEDNNIKKQKLKKKCAKKFRKHKNLKFKTTIKSSFSNREVLQIPCFTFPRYGESFTFNGRKTLCNQYNNELLSNELIRIRALSSTNDFVKLLQRHEIYLKHLNKSVNQQQSIQEETAERYLTKENINNLIKYHKLDREIRTKRFGRYKIKHKQQYSLDNNNKIDTDNEAVQQLNHLIDLASQYYYEGFQCHLDYLNYCMHKGASIKQRYLEKTRIDSSTSTSANDNLVNSYNIGTSRSTSCSSSTKNSDNCNNTTAKRQSTKYISTKTNYEVYNNKITTKLTNIMNNCINLNNNSSNTNRNTSLNNVIEDFYKLNISKRGLRPPQITFTDFSTTTTATDYVPQTPTTPSSASSLSSASSSGGASSSFDGNIYVNHYLENLNQPNCFQFNQNSTYSSNSGAEASTHLNDKLEKCLNIPSHSEYNHYNSESRPPSSFN